jgi:hypothetical protein
MTERQLPPLPPSPKLRPVYRDGHTIRITLETEAVRLDIECPHGAVPPGTAWGDLPHCRQPCDEDGQELRDDGPLTYCNLETFLTSSDGIESYLDTCGAEYEVTAAPIQIEYWWVPEAECYLWRPATTEVTR